MLSFFHISHEKREKEGEEDVGGVLVFPIKREGLKGRYNLFPSLLTLSNAIFLCIFSSFILILPVFLVHQITNLLSKRHCRPVMQKIYFIPKSYLI